MRGFCKGADGSISFRAAAVDRKSSRNIEFAVICPGQLLVIAIEGADIPLVQTLTFIFAVLIVAFNLVADVVYGILDPRIRYD